MDLWTQQRKGRARRTETWEHTLPHASETDSGSLLCGAGGWDHGRAGTAWAAGEVPEGRARGLPRRFMVLCGRNQHDIVRQFSFDKN